MDKFKLISGPNTLSGLASIIKNAMAKKQDKLTGEPGQVVGFGSDGSAEPVPGWSNPNLVINWNLCNPVNRRGQTEYTERGYTIDRWSNQSEANITVRVGDDGLTIQNPNVGKASWFTQWFEFPLREGTVCTLSALVDLIEGTFSLGTNEASYALSSGLCSATVQVTSSLNFLTFTGVGALKIKAIKLELGDRQTLARQNAAGEWEIIDPPNYDLQYALCSLYSPITGEWIGYRHSNTNLLDNCYFPDPINQRGQTEYSGNGYTIDRWYIYTGRLEIISGSHITIARNNMTDYFDLRQYLEGLDKDLIYTFSILSNGELYSVTGTFTSNPSTKTPFGEIMISWGGGESNIVLIRPLTTDPVNITAAKLELGPVQTLVHKEGDTWVLNDPPPNKALELLKCQRYFAVLGSEYWLSPQGSHSRLTVQFPVIMRANPAVTFDTLYNAVRPDIVVAKPDAVHFGSSDNNPKGVVNIIASSDL